MQTQTVLFKAFVSVKKSLLGCVIYNAMLEIMFGHWTLSDQIILKMSGQFHIMIGHNDQTSQPHILSFFLLSSVNKKNVCSNV